MKAQLLLAPAAAGKTATLLDLVRNRARDLLATPRVVVPTHLQARAWRRRLAEAGGAIGVRVLTFDRLYAECLNVAGEAYTQLSDPVQYRLIRAVVDGLDLAHNAPLAAKPGFVHVLQRLIGELKAARVHPDVFLQAAEGIGGEARLVELARIYAAYQARLQLQGWADRAGLGWLAVEALEGRASRVGSDWPLLVVDGFDSLTSVQLALLKVLAGRVGELIVTLTGTVDGGERPLVHRRFDETRRRVEAELDVRAEPMTGQASLQASALVHLEAQLYRTPADQVEAAGVVELTEAPDRAAEVRAALRWLKARLVEDGLRPDEVALLARKMIPYRPFVLQTAAEFGLPVRLVGGYALRKNPAVVALLDLLRLMLPGEDGLGPVLPRRMVVEAWRSPYFDWSALPVGGALSPGVPGTGVPESIGIAPPDADLLDCVARWGRVIGGLAQWEEALANLAARAENDVAGDGYDEERGWPKGVPRGPEASALGAKFGRFVERLTPPAGSHPYRELVQWLEALIGPDPQLQSERFPVAEEPTALQIVARARLGAGTADRDVAALQAFKDILRGLVWAEEALGTGQEVTFAEFFAELAGAVEAATYQVVANPVTAGPAGAGAAQAEIVVADVVQARGVPFRAVAVLGLAEGEFPAVIGEDAFLRDSDRSRLREGYGLDLEPSIQSAEAEFFYETVARPRERLLLTRPRLADNGALWQASPFWEEVRRLVQVEPEVLTSESLPVPDRAASWPELMESLAAHAGYGQTGAWVAGVESGRQSALDLGVRILQLRSGGGAASAYDGDLGALAGTFEQHFAPGAVWSASRLEAYRACPFFFFVQNVLHLEPREEPAEGLDATQLGTLYHRILEEVHRAPDVDDPADLVQLLAVLPQVAAVLLDAAPEELGFRETAWWAQTRSEIVENVKRSLEALAALPGGFEPFEHEAAYGLKGEPPLVVREGADSFQLRGYIDRVDRVAGDANQAAGLVRIIDYKTAGPWAFSKKAVVEGKKLQLPLYALAARDALGLGEPVEGFYWHVRQAEPSSFKMSTFDGGPQGALDVAVEKAWEAIHGAREGYFGPKPPDGGCPGYCPAGGFCWHYQQGWGGR